MKLTIINGNWRQRKYGRSLVEYAWKNLHFDKDMDLSIEIFHLSDKIKSFILSGETYYLNYQENGPKRFLIYINGKRSLQNFMRTLSHELIHVEQFATEKLQVSGDDEFIWMGKKHKKFNYPENKHYKLLEANRVPWEVEANGLKDALLMDWIRENYCTFPRNIINMFYEKI